MYMFQFILNFLTFFDDEVNIMYNENDIHNLIEKQDIVFTFL